MPIYEGFADFYVRGIWAEHSRRMASLFPGILRKFGISPKTILDLASGDGTFAVAMARLGYKLTGVDNSRRMLYLARKRALEEKLKMNFVCKDMRCLEFHSEFDVATCWFDSLNYLIETEDLAKTFAGVWQALRPGGYFIFDMATIPGLLAYYDAGITFGEAPVLLQLDTADSLLINRPTYDFDKNIATWRITGFMRRGNTWRRSDEEHKERGYTLHEIRHSFLEAGFTEVTAMGDLASFRAPEENDHRVWFVLKK
ncbi:MAG: methyltransferase domain-containing protein [Chloroflexota bacterium]